MDQRPFVVAMIFTDKTLSKDTAEFPLPALISNTFYVGIKMIEQVTFPYDFAPGSTFNLFS